MLPSRNIPFRLGVDFPGFGIQLAWVYYGDVPIALNEWSRYRPSPTGVFFVDQGSISIRTPSQTVQCDSGDLFIGGPGFRQHCVHEPIRMLSMGIHVRGAESRFLNIVGQTQKIPVDKGIELRRLTEGLLSNVYDPSLAIDSWYLGSDCQREPGDFEESIELAEKLITWMKAFTSLVDRYRIRQSDVRSHDHRVDLALEILEHWPVNKPLPREEICRQTELSWRRVEQLFMRDLRHPPFSFYDHKRLSFAQDKLCYTRCPIKEIAFDLGFNRPGHFSAWFSKQIGMSPKKFRETKFGTR